jgi:ribonuclease VapC
LFPVLDGDECAIGAPTLVEARLWCSINLRTMGPVGWRILSREVRARVVIFSRDMADVVSAAFARFGRASGHLARLDFGGCLAYAVAAVILSD